MQQTPKALGSSWRNAKRWLHRGARLQLLLCLLVIAGGAVVRATGSGAGCGDSWPLCQGQVVPERAAWVTVVEYSHRLSSGLLWLLGLGLWLLARRVAPKHSAARTLIGCTWLLLCVEALIGAGLVLLRLVAYNPALMRGLWVGAHLLNTFVLLACATAAVVATQPQATAPLAFPVPWRALRMPLALMAGEALVGITGAITALGDTLFPASTLIAGWLDDWDPDAHLWVRLRGFHPLLASAFCIALWRYASQLSSKRALAGRVLAFAAPATGLLGVVLLVPLWTQLLHLLLADLTLILLALCATDQWQRAKAQSSERSLP